MEHVAIDIVEPTLRDERGHTHSFVRSLCHAAVGAPVRVWAAREATFPDLPPGVELIRHFHRSVRRAQVPFLYRRLLAAGGRVLVATAERFDLVALDLAAGGRPIPPGRVFLYFHWFTQRPGKRQAIQRLARRQPGLGILGPTESVVRVFQECGYLGARVVPYPLSRLEGPSPGPPQPFRRVIFAGAPRSDKGFGAFVAMIEELVRSGANFPVALQAAVADAGSYRTETRLDLARLLALRYAPLEVLPDPMPEADYAAAFAGGICVQPYQAEKFADRVSGVTLDALAAGCPVIAVEGTWSARVVSRFGAGSVVADTRPSSLIAAVRSVMEGYAGFASAAQRGGRVLLEENDARALYAAVASGTGAPASSA